MGHLRFITEQYLKCILFLMNKELLQTGKIDSYLYFFHKTHEKTASPIFER